MALARPLLVVDFAKVERIDYGVMGELAEAARSLHATGKQVTFVHLSTLNAALLRAFGVDRLVQIAPV